jgi:hypothetical protein
VAEPHAAISKAWSYAWLVDVDGLPSLLAVNRRRDGWKRRPVRWSARGLVCVFEFQFSPGVSL